MPLPLGGQGSAGVRPERPEVWCTAGGLAVVAAWPSVLQPSAESAHAINSGGSGAEPLRAPDQEELADLQGELAGHERRQSELAAGRPQLEDDLDHWTSELAEAGKKLPDATRDIDRQVTLHADVARRVQRHIGNGKDLAEAVKAEAGLKTQIDQSNDKQKQYRDAIATKRAWLSERFSSLCQEFVGGQRRFELEFESKAIPLKIAGTAGTPGEATSTSALVLSLYLAALQSAVDGYGHHPCLMILDSPAKPTWKRASSTGWSGEWPLGTAPRRLRCSR